MRTWPFILCLSFMLLQCKEVEQEAKYRMYYLGKSNVTINDGVSLDTLDWCGCYRAGDTIGVAFSISRLGFAGLTIDYWVERSATSALIQYWSDHNEFDGEFTLNATTVRDCTKVSYEQAKDTLIIKGYIDIEAKTTKHFMIPRKIIAKGNFECKLGDENHMQDMVSGN